MELRLWWRRPGDRRRRRKGSCLQLQLLQRRWPCLHMQAAPPPFLSTPCFSLTHSQTLPLSPFSVCYILTTTSHLYIDLTTHYFNDRLNSSLLSCIDELKHDKYKFNDKRTRRNLSVANLHGAGSINMLLFLGQDILVSNSEKDKQKAEFIFIHTCIY